MPRAVVLVAALSLSCGGDEGRRGRAGGQPPPQSPLDALPGVVSRDGGPDLACSARCPDFERPCWAGRITCRDRVYRDERRCHPGLGAEAFNTCARTVESETTIGYANCDRAAAACETHEAMRLAACHQQCGDDRGAREWLGAVDCVDDGWVCFADEAQRLGDCQAANAADDEAFRRCRAIIDPMCSLRGCSPDLFYLEAYRADAGVSD